MPTFQAGSLTAPELSERQQPAVGRASNSSVPPAFCSTRTVTFLGEILVPQASELLRLSDGSPINLLQQISFSGEMEQRLSAKMFFTADRVLARHGRNVTPSRDPQQGTLLNVVVQPSTRPNPGHAERDLGYGDVQEGSNAGRSKEISILVYGGRNTSRPCRVTR
jgi:hypothetical protein